MFTLISIPLLVTTKRLLLRFMVSLVCVLMPYKVHGKFDFSYYLCGSSLRFLISQYLISSSVVMLLTHLRI